MSLVAVKHEFKSVEMCSQWLSEQRYARYLLLKFYIAESVGRRKWQEIERSHLVPSRWVLFRPYQSKEEIQVQELLLIVHDKMVDDFMWD